MKTSRDPRHRKRQKIVKLLFSYSFSKQPIKDTSTNEIINVLPTIDTIIGTIAPEFPIEKINKIDLAMLRLAVFELTIAKKEPPKVIVDEAVELAKKFGGDSSPGFINGALGNLIKKYQILKMQMKK